MSEPGKEQSVPALFAESVAIMARLRAPDGCPWDREQNFRSIRKYTLEECYEVFDAIDREHWGDLAEELGDLLLQVLFYAQLAQDEGRFSIADVLGHLNRKLVRRHPHVFGDEAAAAAGNRATVNAVNTSNADQVKANWETIKRAEKANIPSSFLDTVPAGFPALLEAAKLGGKAAKVGFDWPDARGLLAKVEEECRELEAEMAAGEAGASAAEDEMGDLLFTVVNLARHLHIDPELALKRSNGKFRRRFGAMERQAAEASPAVPLESLSAAQLESLWLAAKQREAMEQSA